MDVENAMSRSAWFARQPAGLRAALLAAGRVVRLAPGQWVYSEGDSDTGLVAVLDGALRLEASVGPDRTMLIELAQPPAVLGQSRRRGGGPRIVTARAGPASTVWLVGDGALARIGDGDPALWRAVSELLYGQLDASIHLAAQMIALPPRARIAARLAMLARGERVPVSQADLAELCGLSRKATHAHLAALEAAGTIARGYRGITIRDLDRLERAAR
jgi:CRP-like cAMP-binding protein